MLAFQHQQHFSQRRSLSERCLLKRPGFLPLFIAPYSAYTPPLPKNLYCENQTETWGRLMCKIRHALIQTHQLEAVEALHFFVGEHKIMPRDTDTIQSLYNQYQDDDGLLYIQYSKEHTFG